MPAWKNILDEMQKFQRDALERSQHHQDTAERALDSVRRDYLKKLHAYTKRNTIAYYSGFLSRTNRSSDINDEDLNGFMNAIHGLNRSLGLDLILHTPGGSVSATISIVHYIRKMFGNDVRVIVPQIAMSAGTMIACSAKSIVMGKHSQLGPTDPHLAGVPAAGVIMEFKRACKEVKADKDRIPIWQAIIGQYRPTFISQCENAMEWARQFVETELAICMLASYPDARKRAKGIVKKLTHYTDNKRHDRPIHADECKSIGLTIEDLEADSEFQDLVLSVHHCYMHAFMNGRAYKIIENHIGGSMVKIEAGQRPI
jgi:ATP-dependent protease ClpP protease subunit